MDINSYVERLEVCDRKDGLTLAIWFKREDYVVNTIIPELFSLFPEVTTEAMLSKYEELLVLHPSSYIAVQLDPFSNVLRFYYGNNDGFTYGIHINQNGDIVKEKVYQSVDFKVQTTHMYPNGEQNVTQTDIYLNSSFNGCIMETERDDGQTYYFYNV